MVLSGLITAAISIPGGLLTVVYTDLVQAIILLCGFGCLTYSALARRRRLAGLRKQRSRPSTSRSWAHASAGWGRVSSIVLALVIGCIADPSRRLTMYSARTEPGASWSMVTAGADRDCVLGRWWASSGMYAYLLNPNLAHADQALPWLVMNVLPPWLAALVVVSIASAIFSSANGNAAAAGTFFVRHIYPLVTGRYARRPLVAVRRALACAFVLSTALALFAGTIVEFVLKFLPITMSGLAVIILLGRYWPRATWQGALAALVTAPVVSLVVMFVPAHAGVLATTRSFPATLAGLIAQVVVSLLTPPRTRASFEEVAAEMTRETRQNSRRLACTRGKNCHAPGLLQADRPRRPARRIRHRRHQLQRRQLRHPPRLPGNGRGVPGPVHHPVLRAQRQVRRAWATWPTAAKYLIDQFAPSVPVALHLDHGQEFADCVEAVRAGFTSVMCDGSKLPLEENIALTRKVVEMAAAVGVTVEAEVGQLLSGEIDPNSPAIVQVDDVRRFTAAVEVDMLAVAIGNSHGYYKGVPIINTQRLKEVRAVTDVPLVLHGCTGMAEATVKECIGLGMAKINFGTMLRNNYLKYFDEAYHNTDHQGHPVAVHAVCQGQAQGRRAVDLEPHRLGGQGVMSGSQRQLPDCAGRRADGRDQRQPGRRRARGPATQLDPSSRVWGARGGITGLLREAVPRPPRPAAGRSGTRSARRPPPRSAPAARR